MKEINVCVVGYGSIGSRHAKILNGLKQINKVFVLSNVTWYSSP